MVDSEFDNVSPHAHVAVWRQTEDAVRLFGRSARRWGLGTAIGPYVK